MNILIGYILISIVLYFIILRRQFLKYGVSINLEELINGFYSEVSVYAVFWIISVPVYLANKYKITVLINLIEHVMKIPIVKSKKSQKSQED